MAKRDADALIHSVESAFAAPSTMTTRTDRCGGTTTTPIIDPTARRSPQICTLRPVLRKTTLMAALVALLLASAPALASHEGGSQPGQPAQPAQQAQPVPSQGGAPQPAAPAAEEDEEDSPSGLLIAGIVVALVAVGGVLAVAKERRGGPRPAN